MNTDIDWSKAPDDCLGAVHLKEEYVEINDTHGIFVTKTKGLMNDGYHYCGHTHVGPQIEKYDFTPKPVTPSTLTQTMPSIGFKLKYQHEFVEDGEYQYLSNESGAGWEDGDNLEVISLRVNSHGEDVAIVLNTPEDVLTCAALTVGFFKPLTPPIELIDGNAYQFDYHSGKGVHGIYHKPDEDGFAIFRFADGAINKEVVTNIKPLTVEGE